MTRKEETIKATEEFLNDKDPNLAFALGGGFMFGAEWADEHPRKGLVDIDKVCEWLDENLLDYWSQTNANNTKDFINDFKKAMED